MRKSILTFIALAMISVSFANQQSSELFNYSQTEVDAELALLNTIEAKVEANPGIDFKAVQSQDAQLLAEANLQPTTANQAANGPLLIPSFIWGCVLSVVGVAIVYFVTDDMGETKKAVLGCLVSTIVFGFSWFGFLS